MLHPRRRRGGVPPENCCRPFPSLELGGRLKLLLVQFRSPYMCSGGLLALTYTHTSLRPPKTSISSWDAMFLISLAQKSIGLLCAQCSVHSTWQSRCTRSQRMCREPHHDRSKCWPHALGATWRIPQCAISGSPLQNGSRSRAILLIDARV